MSQVNDDHEGSVFPSTASVDGCTIVPPQFTDVSQLLDIISSVPGNSYRHHLLKEKPERRSEFITVLKPYFQDAHEDVRRHLRDLANISLAPDENTENTDPVAGYPQCLSLNTLTGYFGEVFVAWAIENLPAFKAEKWQVPAFLFRFHVVELQQLEHLRQTGGHAKQRPGRTGDDFLAFQLDDDWKIKRILYCEAKCATDHDAGQISKAHDKVSSATIQDILRLIEVLKDRNDVTSQKWVESLRRIYLAVGTIDRYDLVSYICGKRPVQKHSWISTDRPHAGYSGNRHLDVIEAHLNEVEVLIKDVYGMEEPSSAI